MTTQTATKFEATKMSQLTEAQAEEVAELVSGYTEADDVECVLEEAGYTLELAQDFMEQDDLAQREAYFESVMEAEREGKFSDF